MNDPLSQPASNQDEEIAAAEWLFQDAPKEPARPNEPAAVVEPGADEEFALADPSSIVDPPISTAPPHPVESRPRNAPVISSRPSPTFDPSAKVEQVWSRGAEWGTTLAILVLWAILVGGLVYFALSGALYEPAAVTLIVGAVVGIVLSYPILITLERPVRVTPEQAARDFYGALSHHVPHFRRMWLLLGSQGRLCGQFASYEGFKAYWKARLTQLRQDHAGPFSPLAFVVEDFRAERDASKMHADGRFRVRVFVRGKRDQGPIWSFPVETTFVRGPDKMWYLNCGTLGENQTRRDEAPDERWTA